MSFTPDPNAPPLHAAVWIQAKGSAIPYSLKPGCTYECVDGPLCGTRFNAQARDVTLPMMLTLKRISDNAPYGGYAADHDGAKTSKGDIPLRFGFAVPANKK